jgi:hypothetical protein
MAARASTDRPLPWYRRQVTLRRYGRHSDAAVLGIYDAIGCMLGGVGGLCAFVAVLVAAIASTGWFVGIILGWLAAALACGATFFVLRYLWPIGLLFLLALLYQH